MTDAPKRQPLAKNPWLLGLSLVVIAFNMRAAVTSLGPVLNDIMRATGLSTLAASVLTTVPPFCFGLGAVLAPRLLSRASVERILAVMLAVLTLGCALRGFGAIPALFLGQIFACLSIGIINVLVPSVVKRDFAAHAAPTTALYSMTFCAGAAVAAGVTAPAERVFGGSWAAALASWSAPAALALVFWMLQGSRRQSATRPAVVVAHRLWSDPLAWQLTLFMGLQSALAYIVFGWLVPVLRDRGLDGVEAGLVLSVSVAAQAVGSLAAPLLATRGRDQRIANVAAVVLGLAGLMGCAYAPLASVWVWGVILGLAQGALVALALTLIVLRSPDTFVAAHLSGMCQSVGYIVASAGPFVVGILHARTGSWNAALLVSAAISAAMLPCAWGAGRNRTVRSARVPANAPVAP